jgi:hypothetical protein
MSDNANKQWPEFGTRDVLRDFLLAHGFPITRGTLDQWCAPARHEGPPIKGYWGRRPIYNLQEGLVWAQARVRETRYELHPRSE